MSYCLKAPDCPRLHSTFLLRTFHLANKSLVQLILKLGTKVELDQWHLRDRSFFEACVLQMARIEFMTLKNLRW
jgi:hypothetical protein